MPQTLLVASAAGSQESTNNNGSEPIPRAVVGGRTLPQGQRRLLQQAQHTLRGGIGLGQHGNTSLLQNLGTG